jgi:hypothetical protein
LLKIENRLIFNFFNRKITLNKKKKTLFLIKEIFSILLGHSMQGRIFFKNTKWLSFFFYRFFLKKFKTGAKSNKENTGTIFRFFYFLLRLEEKYYFFENRENDFKEKEVLLSLRNLYLQKLNNKLLKNKYFLSTVKGKDLKSFRFFKIKSRRSKRRLKGRVKRKVRQKKYFRRKDLTEFLNNFSSLEQKQLYSSKFFFKKKQKTKRKIKKMKIFLSKEKKIQQNEKLFVLNDLHKIFSLILGNQTSLIFINALTLTKYAYKGKLKRANYFLSKVERDLIQKYKYIAIYIQDFVRICFFSIFLKRLTFLTNFLGFQLSELPKNRKETKFIRFLMKVIKMFAGQRSEISGLKIEFKGRVNR